MLRTTALSTEPRMKKNTCFWPVFNLGRKGFQSGEVYVSSLEESQCSLQCSYAPRAVELRRSLHVTSDGRNDEQEYN
jgi:hypothetical protein